MTIRVFHCSDLHAGPPFDAAIADIVLQDAQRYAPDLFVVSGDFVQRADNADQWQTITAWLSQTPEPRFVVPGNHDVPLYHVYKRLFDPYFFYRRHISTDLMPVMHLPGVSVVGLVSAHGWCIDSGYVNAAQRAHLRHAVSQIPAGNRRVVVMHHQLVNPPGVKKRARMRNSDQVAALLDECAIDVVLSGHLHLSYVGHTRDTMPELARGTLICQSGTSTSRRGKSRERHMCAYNTLEITAHDVLIQRHLFDVPTRKFVVEVEHRQRWHA
ncbi:MAG: metallophosphoesterase [Chloroflexi bacterium]|nr:metallophosphoesterase [Chloroflexota bacterium]